MWGHGARDDGEGVQVENLAERTRGGIVRKCVYHYDINEEKGVRAWPQE